VDQIIILRLSYAFLGEFLVYANWVGSYAGGNRNCRSTIKPDSWAIGEVE
jgi:hypothetical protein